MRLFEETLIRNLSARFGEYQGVRFSLGRAQQRTEDDVLVNTIIERPSTAPFTLDWRVSDVGGQPKIVLRPHLEIHHDKVQAAHGATWGALPDEAIFYARQRGLDEREARAMIVRGMAHAVLARALDAPDLLDTLGIEALLAQAVDRHLASAAEAHHG